MTKLLTDAVTRNSWQSNYRKRDKKTLGHSLAWDSY